MTRQSGSSLNSKGIISRLGNENLRTALYFPAIVAKRFNPLIRDFCERLTEKGKSGKQVICAAIRKLLHIIFGVLKSGKTFDPNYQNLELKKKIALFLFRKKFNNHLNLSSGFENHALQQRHW